MDIIDQYLIDCELRGLEHKTRDLYRTFLVEFPRDIADREHLIRWLMGRYPNPRTRHGAFRAIRTFLRWQARLGLCQDWVSGMRLKCPSAPREAVLSEADVGRILSAMPRTQRGLRDRALYGLIFYCGLRRDSARCLRRDQLWLHDRLFRTRDKGGCESIHSIPRTPARMLNDWLTRAPESSYIFPSLTHPDKPVDPGHVTRAIHIYALRAGFERRVHVHLLRHSHAQALVDAGVPLEVVQADLGHRQISTTQIYARISQARIDAAYRQVWGD